MSVESEYRDQIESTFFEARKLATSDRSAFLDVACRGNDKLRNAVRDLLDADADAESFFDTPINLEETSSLPADDYEGTMVGRYKLLQKLGEGGFGVVFMAEQAEPVHRKVALKIIKPGMDSRAVIARFEAERQALAMMNHPNVASVLDGGTTDTGRPFFVMELIRGVSITEYCNKKRLGTKDRLRLFVDVCNAVQHAHQNGIIHRDLKPSNVMITLHDGKPVVKVIDFGVAKAVNQHLTSKTLFTRYGQMIGTPQYMSPEQAEMSGLDVDTRSDIYTLGVLLYELLTGSTPVTEDRLRQATYVELQRIICDEDLPKPSVRLSATSAQGVSDLAQERGLSFTDLRKEIRDELDCIVMKTLEKERNRRYRTAIELADDVNRYINDEAVEARPPSVGYRVKKYVRKNRLFVGTATAIAAILLVSTITSSSLAWWAVAEKSVADDKKKEATEALEAESRALKNLEHAKEDLQRQTQSLIEKIYEAHFVRATTAYDNGDLGQAKASLAECPETARGWEWKRLNFLVNSQRRVTLPDVPDAVFADDSRFLLTCGGKDTPNMIITWNADTGERAHALTVGEHALTNIALHPAGRIATVGDDQGSLTAIDILSGEVLWTKATHAKGVADVVYSPDGKSVATIGRNRLLIWNAVSGELLMTRAAHSRDFNNVAYSPDGRRVATVARDGFLRIWHTVSGALLVSQRHSANLVDVSFDPTGTYVLAFEAEHFNEATKGAVLFDAKSGKMTYRLDHFDRPTHGATFSPDGKHVACNGEYGVIIRNTANARVERVLATGGSRLGTGAVNSVCYSPDGRWLAVQRGGVLLLWEITTGRIAKRFGGEHSSVSWQSFSPDGAKLAARVYRERGSLESAIHIYDVFAGSDADGLVLGGTLEGAVCVAFSPDSNRVAAAGVERTIRIWDRGTNEETNALYGHTDVVWRMAWSNDGQSLFSHDHAGFLRAWDIENGSCRWVARTLPQPDDFRGYPNVNGLAVTPDGEHILLSWINGETIVFDARSGKEKTRLRGQGEENINGVACSPDGKWIATGSHDSSIVIWDASTLEKSRILEGHKVSVRAVAFSPNSQLMASGSYDGTVRLWDPESGKMLHTLRGHEYGVWTVDFSEDGRRLFSADGPGLIVVWDLEHHREIYRWRHENYGNRFDVSPDGSSVITANAFGDVRLWETIQPDAETLKKRRLFDLARQAVDNANQAVAFAGGQAKRIEADDSINDDVREAALRLIAVRGDDPYVLNRAAWEIIRDGNEGDYQRALDLARRALELVPGCSDYAITAGVAHFRINQFQECVDVLHRAETNLLPKELDWDKDPRIDMKPYLYATLAMAQHQLGETELTEKAFNTAKEHRKNQRVVDPNVDAYLRDAEALLHAKPQGKQGQ